MDTLMGNICLVAALGSLLCNAAPVSDSLGVSSTSSVSVPQGHTTTLPCWLNPAHSAEGLEVRWYLVDFDFPVFLYRAKKFENASQDASYRDRVSFGLKDAVSGGLKAGDVSLKLENVMLEDAGDYTCYVSSDQGYDSASVSLAVTKMGNPPLLSFTWKDDNMVNVSCETGGWHPKPDLHWSDKNKVLPSKNTKYSKDSSGLLSVHSWLLVPTSSEVSCSVGLSGEEAKEARMRLGNPPQAESASSAGGWVAFTLLLIAVLAGLGVLYYKQRVKKAEPGSDITDGRKAEPGCDISEENNELLPKEVTDLKQYHGNH
uniref:butyrophilin subfamily 2 member A1-like n=1 Tax=Semicossyphus pulcher TaxID=241346 RepID=UPI0037E96157